MNNLRFLRHKMEGRAFVLEACFLPPVPTPLPALPFMAGPARPRPSRQRRDSLAERLTPRAFSRSTGEKPESARPGEGGEDLGTHRDGHPPARPAVDSQHHV